MKTEYVKFEEEYKASMSSYFKLEIEGQLSRADEEDRGKIKNLLDFLFESKFFTVLSRSEDTVVLKVPSDFLHYLDIVDTNKGLPVPAHGVVKLEESTIEKYKSEIERFCNEVC